MIYIMLGSVCFFGIVSYILIIENSKLRYYNIINKNTKVNTVITNNVEQMLKELLQYVTTIEEINYLVCKGVEVVPNILLNQDKEIQEKEKNKEVLKYWYNSFISQAAISFRTTTDEYFKIKKFLSKETDSCYNTILSNVGNFLNTKIKELENNEREDSNIE